MIHRPSERGVARNRLYLLYDDGGCVLLRSALPVPSIKYLVIGSAFSVGSSFSPSASETRGAPMQLQ